MQILANRTLDQRLSAMVSLVSGLVLSFAVAIFTGAAITGAREDLQQRLTAWSDAIASGGQRMLLADDGKVAAGTLQALGAEPQIVSATLTRGAAVAASYHGASNALQHAEQHWFVIVLTKLLDRYVTVERAISVNDTAVGSVRLVGDLADTWLVLERRLGLICVLAGAGYLLMMFLARRMRRAILRPIDRLAQAVNTVSAEGRYAVRVSKESDDEIGALVDEFNRMLVHIEARDTEIETARMELERRTIELTAANEQLQSEVDERRAAEAALREAKEVAEAAECASRAKSQFLADMSQEIRAPMQSVQGMIELLLASELTPRQRHYAQSVQRSSETLLDVFNGILDFSKVEAGRMEIEAVEFSCRETVGEVVRQLSERASRKGLRLTSRAERDVPNRVVGDPSRLKQVLLNLVGNAIKFTDRGDVRIHLSVWQRHGDTFALRFAVHDTGVGIAPDAHESIFEAFAQIEGESDPAQSGSGLGLTVAKQLVQLMGGEIGVESMPGRGSTFWFTVRVPQTRNDALTTARQELHEIGPPPKFHGWVLVAVGESMRRGRIEQALVEQGVDLVIAQNAQEALDAVLSGGIDLLFIDCEDGAMDGLAVTRAVRDAHNKAVWRMPIVGVGTNRLQEDRDSCLRAGMDDYLVMPFESSDLLGLLARWLPTLDGAEDDLGEAEPIPPEAVKTLEPGAIDEIRALARDDGEALLNKVISLYCESVPQMLTSMQEAARRGDCISLQRAAHALRTSSHNVGAMRLAQLCRDLESGARSGVIRFERLTALEFEFDSVRNKLKRVA